MRARTRRGAHDPATAPANLSFSDRDALLRAMGDARDRASLCGGASGFGSPRHRLCADMQKAIDALAADLTGDPAYFVLKPAPSSCQREE